MIDAEQWSRDNAKKGVKMQEGADVGRDSVSAGAVSGMTLTSDAHIQVRDLVVRYGTVTAVDGVSFEVQRGEHMTLLGPSGCGKTTTLRAIAGLETPTSGEIIIDGEPVFSSISRANVPTEKRQVSMVFQSYAIWPHMTVFNNVVYGLRVRKEKEEIIQEKGAAALKLVQMEAYDQRKASALSGGQQQRVALARSIAFDPRVLLFDEPLSNLDANLRVEMRLQIAALQKRTGITALYVTHDQEEALSISDKIIVMNQGKIVQMGTPNEIYNRPVSRFLANFIGSANLLEGTISSDPTASGDYVLTTTNGESIEFVGPGRRVSLGAEGCVSIRTVYLQLGHTRPEGVRNAWPVRVTLSVFSGDFMEYHVDWGGREMVIRRPPTDRFQEGEDLFMWVDTEFCVLLEQS